MNNFGEYSLIKLNQRVNESEKRQVVQNTVKAVYSGKYIVGSDYVLIGLAKNMMRPSLIYHKLDYPIVYAH